MLFNVYQVEDLDIVKATFSLYNDWIAELLQRAAARASSPSAACSSMTSTRRSRRWSAARRWGYVGICIPATAPPDHLYSDPWYDKFWAAAQEMRLPLNMHIFTGATPNHGLATASPAAAPTVPWRFAGAGMTVCDLIQSGVCERFPDLKFVDHRVRDGLDCPPPSRLDWAFVRGGGLRTSGLTMLPSAYWRRNFAITFEDDPLGIMTRSFIGTETMLWGNDYPHGDSVFPHSQQVLSEILSECTPEERWQMTVENVVRALQSALRAEQPEQARINSAADTRPRGPGATPCPSPRSRLRRR